MANPKNKVVEEVVEPTSSETTEIVNSVDNAMKQVAATAALKASIEASSEMAIRKAEREYVTGKQKYMLAKCKSDPVVRFVGSKVYATYFGKVYTFLYNTIPVTVRFDGSTQEFPKFIYDKIMEKIAAVDELNEYKEHIEERAE